MEVNVTSPPDRGSERRFEGISVLLIGCGSIGRRHARVLSELGVRDVRVYDPDVEQSRRVAAEVAGVTVEASLSQALEKKPFAVFVLTPPASHIELSVRSLRAGCHVFCEKPLSFAVDQLDLLGREVAESGKRFAVGLCFRYHPGLVEAKARIAAGAIGRLVSIRGHVGEHLPTVRPDYRTLFSSRYLGVFDLIHDIDLALWFAGEEPSRAFSIHGNFSDVDMAAPDAAEVTMEFPNRCIASVHLNFFQKPRRRSIELIGTEGTLRVEFGSWDRYTIEEYKIDEQRVSEHTTERDEMFRAEDREFLTSALEGAPTPVGYAEGSRSIRVLSTIYPELDKIARDAEQE